MLVRSFDVNKIYYTSDEMYENTRSFGSRQRNVLSSIRLRFFFIYFFFSFYEPFFVKRLTPFSFFLFIRVRFSDGKRSARYLFIILYLHFVSLLLTTVTRLILF